MTAIDLTPRLDHGAAVELHDNLSVASEGDVVLNASAVTHLGSICTQVLIVAARTAKANGHKFSFAGLPEKIEAQLGAMGLSSKMIEEGV